MKITVIGALALLVIAIVAKPAAFGHAFAAIAPASWVSDQDFLANAAKTFNANGPMRIDDNLVVLGADVHETGIVLSYQITSHTREQLAQTNFAEVVGGQVTGQACAGDLVPAILERDLDVEYVYFDKKDDEIASVPITRGDCG